MSRHGGAMARPVYLQQRTYLVSVASAVECQERPFGGPVYERPAPTLCGMATQWLGRTFLAYGTARQSGRQKLYDLLR